MGNDKLIIEFSEFDDQRVLADLATIRGYNRQRFEMEQLTAIVHEDNDRHICVGYKDLALDEFWARGHMPGFPILPGVVLCEIAAQLCSYYSARHSLLGENMTLGFGGMNDVRFRDVVRPGQRIYAVCQLVRVRKGRLIVSRFQAFVDRKLVAEGEILGIALPIDDAASPPAAG